MLSQKQITKRIVGTRLQQLKLTPIARGDGSYKVDMGPFFILFKVWDNGNVTALKMYKAINCTVPFSGLSNLFKQMGEE